MITSSYASRLVGGTFSTTKRLSVHKRVNACRRAKSTLPTQRQLRILFCGSDDFSVTSLKALHEYSKESESNVLSIDIATKSDKRVGRGLKLIRPPPIKPVAQDLGLRLHQFDHFTKAWNLPTENGSDSTYINLIIAVSFGLMIPARILAACQHGGLNVHPSMLPDLKGSAPIEHAIINGYRKTGVSVQTLHPREIDAGKVLRQTPWPGLDIPRPDSITALELREMLAPVGAKMLVDYLRDSTPLDLSTSEYGKGPDSNWRRAPKFSPDSRQINFQEMGMTQILRLNRAFGRLWVNVTSADGTDDTRMILGEDIHEARSNELEHFSDSFLSKVDIGRPFNVIGAAENAAESKIPLLVKTIDSEFLSIPHITISGRGKGPALAAAAKASMLQGETQQDQIRQYLFRDCLR